MNAEDKGVLLTVVILVILFWVIVFSAIKADEQNKSNDDGNNCSHCLVNN